MRTNSSIEWTETTWNPVTGCTKVSQGCKFCYAERMSKRLRAMGSPRYENGFRLTLHDDLIDLPRTWKKGRMIFVNSMSDLFHEDVPVEFISRVLRTIEECPHHTFQILTKRSERLREISPLLSFPANAWIGVSIENRETRYRINDLLSVDAAVRFLSCEPLIGPLGRIPLKGIQWVIVGGESGPGARPMESEWVESIYRQCRRAEVAFFFKQWGGVRKHVTGRDLHGTTYDEMPEVRFIAEEAEELV